MIFIRSKWTFIFISITIVIGRNSFGFSWNNSIDFLLMNSMIMFNLSSNISNFFSRRRILPMEIVDLRSSTYFKSMFDWSNSPIIEPAVSFFLFEWRDFNVELSCSSDCINRFWLSGITSSSSVVDEDDDEEEGDWGRKISWGWRKVLVTACFIAVDLESNGSLEKRE